MEPKFRFPIKGHSEILFYFFKKPFKRHSFHLVDRGKKKDAREIKRDKEKEEGKGKAREEEA